MRMGGATDDMFTKSLDGLGLFLCFLGDVQTFGADCLLYMCECLVCTS